MSALIAPDWVEHRRDDGERLGWIHPAGALYTAVDVLGRTVAADVEWLDAEAALEQHGLAWLAEPWGLRLDDGRVQRVRISQLSPAGITVVEDDWGAAAAVGAGMLERSLPWPAPAELQLWCSRADI
ncbi:hypothetical protein [Microcella sp.]|uniref:hypothetical protein n=1 Tax=Microcella sp. TaxID=1913979 RepID=UPI00255E38D6|nr:hypothetical protein [Microcella sp.]MBX9470386.1 hypothetical protein [Microcella sp.]